MARRSKLNVLRWPEYGIAYALVRALSAAVGLLPERAAVFVGVALGWVAWTVWFPRRRIARRNIEQAMPGELSPADVRRIVREVFLHIGLSAVETLWSRSRVTKENIEERFPVEGVEATKEALARGRGVVAFTPHLGNWELFGAAMAARLGGFSALARPVNNPLLRRYTTRLRESFGMKILSTRDGARPLVRALKNGEALAVLVDQHVNRSFVAVDFFGRKAATTAVVASLALRLDVPVFHAYSLRDGHSFRHRGYLVGPLELIRTGDHDADVAANTQRFNDHIEAVVRRHPEQWLWTHRRWKLAERLEQANPKETSADVA